MSRSTTIIDDGGIGDPSDWLYNPHAGDHIRLDFMEPLELSAADLAQHIGVPVERVSGVVDGSRRIDGEMDLRLARYYGMSPGFFLGLQIDYEILQAKRTLNGELDRIIPRAA